MSIKSLDIIVSNIPYLHLMFNIFMLKCFWKKKEIDIKIYNLTNFHYFKVFAWFWNHQL
jgi:hypothetical protein